MKKRLKIFIVFMFSISGSLFIYALWNIYNSHTQVLSLIDGGYLVLEENWSSIINYYMDNALQYILFAILFIALAYLIRLTFILIEKLDRDM